jgi:hypothetical protein
MKDLLPTPAAAAAAAAADPQQQQQDADTLRLLQAEIPALPVLQRLAAQEAAVTAAAAAAAAAAAGRQAGTPKKQRQQQPLPQQQQQQQQKLMSGVEVAMAISELHHELRQCCDMMDIGLGGGGPRKEDTVAEVGVAAL